MTLQILYQDETCVVVNKPAGMLMHRSWLDKHETTFVMQSLRDQLGRHVYPIHRLDRPTSGAVLFALDSESARAYCQQFEQGSVSKRYLAVVRGYLLDSGVVDYPLKVRFDDVADKYANRDKPPEPAITQYRCLATTEQDFVSAKRYPTSRYSLVELVPITGRKHQLRRHMTHLFHPIVGDTTYGDTAQNRAMSHHVGSGRLLLHAHSLSFNAEHGRVEVIAPLDDEFGAVVERFAWVNVISNSD